MYNPNLGGVETSLFQSDANIFKTQSNQNPHYKKSLYNQKMISSRAPRPDFKSST